MRGWAICIKKDPSNSKQKSDVQKKGFPPEPRCEGIPTIMNNIKRDTVSKITLYDFIYTTKPSKKGDWINSVIW